MTESREAWDQQPDEGAKAFAAFQIYADLPPDKRSLLAAARLYSKKPEMARVPGRISKWSVEYHWTERATMKDAWRQDLRRDEEVRAEQRRAEEWAARRIEVREQGWTLGLGLIERAAEILELPITKKTETEEVVKEEADPERGVIVQFITRTVNIEPLALRARDAALIGKIGLELARLAAGLETSRGLMDLDLSKLSDDELRKLAAGRSIPST